MKSIASSFDLSQLLLILKLNVFVRRSFLCLRRLSNEIRNSKYLITCIPYLKTVVGPTTKFEDARLLIERKIFDVDFARALVNSRRLPLDEALMVDGGLGRQGHLEIPVRAVREPN